MKNILKTIIVLVSLGLTSDINAQTNDSTYYYIIVKGEEGIDPKVPKRLNMKELNRVTNDDLLYLSTDKKASEKVRSRGYNVVKIKKDKVYMTTSLKRLEINTKFSNNRVNSRVNNRR